MRFHKFIEWAFLGIVASGVGVLWQMKESVNQLNTKIEVIVVTQMQTVKEVSDHEMRIRLIEKNKTEIK